MSTVAENIKRATEGTVAALNSWDYDALRAFRTDDFVFQGLPKSLNLPAQDNEAYKQMWDGLLTPMFKTFKFNPSMITYDAEGRKSVVYGVVTADTQFGLQSWELIQMMYFNDSGEKLVRFDEFFDSKIYLDMTGGAKH